MRMNHLIIPQKVRKNLDSMTDLEIARFYYCYEIGTTFTQLSLMEDSVINAMLVCSKIKVNSKLGEDAKLWEELSEKKRLLQDSTLGSLIRILSRHGLVEADLNYLRWIKDKRDFFIHRFFNIGCWPGDMSQAHVNSLVRTLRYLQVLFHRASMKIWKIFERVGLMQAINLGSDGAIMMNENTFDLGNQV